MLVAFVLSRGVLLGEEAREEERERGEEDDRLRDRHRDAGDLLVRIGDSPQSPGPSA